MEGEKEERRRDEGTGHVCTLLKGVLCRSDSTQKQQGKREKEKNSHSPGVDGELLLGEAETVP